MTTPTREQVIEWADQAGITSDDAACQIHDLTSLCTLAMSAGREQGLREAEEVCERTAAEGMRFTGTREQGAKQCAAAIEQLRGK